MAVMIKIFITGLLFTSFVMTSYSQIYVYGGPHRSIIRNDVLLGDSPITAFHFGAGANFYGNRWPQKFFITIAADLATKGYDQYLGSKEFQMRFNYLSTQYSANLHLFSFMSLKLGVCTSLLFNTSVEKGNETYNTLDIGLVGGVDFFVSKRVGFYTQTIIGLLPMLDYYKIDSQGNFNGTIRDLKNTCFMIGIKFNVYDEKIKL